MKLFYVTGRHVHGVYELGRKPKEVRDKYRGERGIKVREVDGMPLQIYRNAKGLLWVGTSEQDARVGLAVSTQQSSEEVGPMEEAVCPRLMRHPLGIEVWTSAGRKGLFQDMKILVSMLRASLESYNEQRVA